MLMGKEPKMQIPKMHSDMKGMPEGLYVGFYHGRENPDEDLDDWGFDGPVIGPLQWWHTTYADYIRAELVTPETETGRALLRAYINEGIVEEHSYTSNGAFIPGGMFELRLHDDMAEVGGKYYGDWSVFYHRP